MKKMRVAVIQEMEVPDSWTVVSREEDNGHFFLIDGKLYRPALEWWRFEGRDEDGTETWAEAHEEIEELQSGLIVQEADSIEEIDEFMFGTDEDDVVSADE